MGFSRVSIRALDNVEDRLKIIGSIQIMGNYNRLNAVILQQYKFSSFVGFYSVQSVFILLLFWFWGGL